MTTTPDPIAQHLVVDAEPDTVFALFTSQLGEWWPLAYTFSGARFAGAAIEPRVGGTWFERTEEGRSLSWGAVRAYDTGQRLVLGFGIGADRQPVPDDEASEVEVRFSPEGGRRTRVEIEHRAFERHGEHANVVRAGMASPQGWPLILAELRRHIRRTHGEA